MGVNSGVSEYRCEAFDGLSELGRWRKLNYMGKVKVEIDQTYFSAVAKTSFSAVASRLEISSRSRGLARSDGEVKEDMGRCWWSRDCLSVVA